LGLALHFWALCAAEVEAATNRSRWTFSLCRGVPRVPWLRPQALFEPSWDEKSRPTRRSTFMSRCDGALIAVGSVSTKVLRAAEGPVLVYPRVM
jgi:hypothetical protein